MSDDSRVIEADIIQAAYADRVKDAFVVFAENLSSGQAEKLCKDRFRRALLLGKKARDLALEALSDEEAAVEPPARIAPASGEIAADPLSAQDRALIDAAVGGTTGVAKAALR
jgi:hypothetical protein